ncbi:activity-regulated cytoskeleton associated protein 1 [Zeugodacus cucurbitae]|uniref:activity-regulated cytoskeleton associated protein 1 n=1 Tax=Zeugodacus cucurbitae TaxID=28588 RepID=UPI0023D9484A|nr:activity-regulated cytoskeleton associated protein 1 [Zeugodacus cucurbitae]
MENNNTVIQMSAEQLNSLIGAARTAPTAAQTRGSLSNCTSHFRGQRDHEAVEEFITAVETYKELQSISDEEALKGLSLLLHGMASTWWQGVRKEAKTWPDAITLIRQHFAPTKPPYQIYLEIFGKKQDERTPIDPFVCQKRALLAQLPEDRHDEETELDLVYGLLNIKYRRHIQRLDVKSFRELLEKGRIIEHNNLEYDTVQLLQATKRNKRCSYCNFRGHTYDECRKRKNENDGKTNEARSSASEATEN